MGNPRHGSSQPLEMACCPMLPRLFVARLGGSGNRRRWFLVVQVQTDQEQRFSLVFGGQLSLSTDSIQCVGANGHTRTRTGSPSLFGHRLHHTRQLLPIHILPLQSPIKPLHHIPHDSLGGNPSGLGRLDRLLSHGLEFRLA